jgi:hypothetical protein
MLALLAVGILALESWHDWMYPLVMTNSLAWYRWPIEIDGLPFLKMVIFHGYVK